MSRIEISLDELRVEIEKLLTWYWFGDGLYDKL